MVEVPRNRPKHVLLLNPGQWVRSGDRSFEDRVVVCLKYYSIVHDEIQVFKHNLLRGQRSGGHAGGLGEQLGGGCCSGSPGTPRSPGSLYWKKGKVNDQNKVKIGRK